MTMNVNTTSADTTQVVGDEEPQANMGNAGATGQDRQDLVKMAEGMLNGSNADTEDIAPQDVSTSEAKPKPKAKGDEDDESKLPKLTRELRQRERERAATARAEEREAAANARFQEAEKAISQVHQIRQELEGQLKRLAEMRTNPVALIQEFGWDPNDIIEAGARHNDPEFQKKVAADRARSEEVRGILEANRKLEARLKDLEGREQKYREQAEQQVKTTQEQKFLATFNESNPVTRLMKAGVWSQQEVLRMAYDADTQVRTKAKRAPTLDELNQYLTFEASKKLRALGVSDTPSKSAAKSKSAVARAISQKETSERRVAPEDKDFNDMSPDEQRKHLIAIAERARRGE